MIEKSGENQSDFFALRRAFEFARAQDFEPRACYTHGINPHTAREVGLTFAQLERELIAQRTREALAVKKAQGVKLGGPVEIPSDVAAMILKHHKAGLSMRAIAGKLNDGQIPTARGGSQWYASTVRVVLEREAA